jgi:LmbE family N-acetylglucosaminyl deacetylase
VTVVAFEPHQDDVVLFASFLAQQHAARVITVLESHVQAGRGLPISQQQRLRENAAAMQELGLTLEQWAFRDDRPDWDAIEQQMVALDRREKPELVLAPAVEPGGHEHHNRVGEAARFVFGDDRVQPYLSYRRGHARSEGAKVGFTGDQLARKLRALACFRSQMCEPSTQPWFLGDQAEYTP